MASVTFISHDQRKFIYSVARDLVWLLPSAGGPLGSASITVIESYDVSAEVHEKLPDPTSALGTRIVDFVKTRDMNDVYRDIRVNLIEVGIITKACVAAINEYKDNTIGMIDKDPTRGHTVVIKQLDEGISDIAARIDRLRHASLQLKESDDLVKAQTSASSAYANPSDFERAIITFDVLMLAIGATLFAYQTKMNLLSWRTAFGDESDTNAGKVVLNMMRAYLNELTAADQTTACPLTQIARGIHSRRSLSVGEIHRIDDLEYAINPAFTYSDRNDGPNNPYVGSRRVEKYSEAGRFACGDYLLVKRYWSCFDVFPLKDACLDGLSPQLTDATATNSDAQGRFRRDRFQINPRVESERKDYTNYNTQDMDLYHNTFALPGRWKAYYFDDLANGDRFHSMDDCWVSWIGRYAQVRYWDARESEIKSARERYQADLRNIADAEFPEGRDQHVQSKIAEWRKLLLGIQEQISAVPEHPPAIGWSDVADAEWGTPGLQVRYGVKFRFNAAAVNRDGQTDTLIYTDWAASKPFKPKITGLPKQAPNGAVIGLTVKREFKHEGRFVSSGIPAIIPYTTEEPLSDWVDRRPFSISQV